MKKTETITGPLPTKRSMAALVMATPKSASRPHADKKAYNRKREQRCDFE